MRGRSVIGLPSAGVALAIYAAVEPYLYRLTTHQLPVAASVPPLEVLHLSDTHLHGGDRRLRAWLRRLPDQIGAVPDLVLATGDMIEDDGGIDPLLEALAHFEARLGCFFVLGSHDYFQSTFQAYTKYWTGRRDEIRAPRADTERLIQGLESLGWVDLTNTSATVSSGAGPIRLSGVDDPYLNRHRTGHIERARAEVAAIGLVHCPDVLSEWILNGYDLVVAGHTHGGQVRLPGAGAVVTNCTLPSALAGGPHHVGSGWLHVSPGLGTGKFSPIRFNCRPEATLLRLQPDQQTRARSWECLPGARRR
jgi:predicted MPP superfamily phosphohydrolase